MLGLLLWNLVAVVSILVSTVTSQSSNVSIALSTWQPGIASLFGGDLNTPQGDEYGATIGSCGYGSIPTTTWPYRSIAALPTTGQGYLAGPAQGCGTCWQFTCVNDGPQFSGKCNPGSAEQSVTVQITDRYSSTRAKLTTRALKLRS